MKKFKLGFGPMSKEIIDILAQYTVEKSYPLMIIASRNQVDHSSGYVCTTKELVDQVKQYKNSNLLICRDHCGPFFCDEDHDLSVKDAIERTKQTIKTDIENGFDLIHIDVSKLPSDKFGYAALLIDYALSLNPNIMLEFGSEENTMNVETTIEEIEQQLKFISKYKNNVKFFVTPTGSFTSDNQNGFFDVERNKKVSELVHRYGFLFKEHNADYFYPKDLNERKDANIDSLNIAPQLGKIQSVLLKEMAPPELWDAFALHVYNKGRWRRWTAEDTPDAAALHGGHYHYNSAEYAAIIAAIDYTEFKAQLKNKLNSLINFYTTFDPAYDAVQEDMFQKKLKERLEELRKRDPFIYR